MSEEFNPFVDASMVPPVLYKYLDWSKSYNQRVLTNNELFLSSPSKFNDPYDCKIPIAYFLLETDKEGAFNYFMDFLTRTNGSLQEYEKTAEAIRLTDEGRFKNFRYMQEQNIIYLKEMARKYGVLCLSHVKDNILMWSHYAFGHTGICIGFHSPILFNNPNNFGAGGPIQYQEKYPIIHPLENFESKSMQQIYLKADFWKYEIEYRLTKFEAADTIVEYPQNAIAEIIIGINTSKEDEDNIYDIAQSRFPKAKIFKAFATDWEFKIGIKKYDK